MSFGQTVIQESAPMTAEQKRIQKVEAEIRKLEDDYDKSKTQHEKNTLGLFPNSFSLKSDKKFLNQKKKDIQAVLYSIQESGLKEKAKQIDILSRSIGNKFSYSKALQNRIDVYDENIRKINNHLSGVQKKEGEEATNKIKQEIEISSLDKEISNLDALLKESKVEESRKSKSLDDFLTEKGKTNTARTKTKSSNSLDDMLSSSTNKKVSKSNSLDDMLGSNTNSSKESGLDDLISTTSDDTDFKIDYKNGLTGIISSRGKVLIPYRDWEIVEYKMGIAKVRKKGETKSCYWSCTSYQEGFVDVNGEFIDGFEIDFSCYKNSGGQPLVIIMTKSGRTYDEIQADERAAKRRKELKRKKNEIQRKKCEIEINNWKRSIKSRYQ
ncbi:hypothetical protein MPF19_18225 [Polaribacter sp. Z014]|nr:hypothetical protein [Polaribacter sp. Z014]